MNVELLEKKEQEIQEILNKLNEFTNNPNVTMKDFSNLVCCLKDVDLSCPLEDTTTQNET